MHVGGTRINRGGRKLLIDGEAPTTTPAVKDTESSNGSGDGGGGAAVAPASTSNGAAGEVAHDPQACSEYSLMDCLGVKSIHPSTTHTFHGKKTCARTLIGRGVTKPPASAFSRYGSLVDMVHGAAWCPLFLLTCTLSIIMTSRSVTRSRSRSRQCNAMQLDGERDDDLPLKCPVLCGTNNNPAPVTSATSTSGTEELDGGDSYGCVPVAAYAGDETIVQLCTSMETACDTQAIFCIYLPPPSTTSTVTTVTTVTTVAAVKTGCVRAEK